ncbi:MAG TPA: hypothetical protein VJ963_09205 [Bacteroidales bacterium]|nr:hypothetical protein [Bacteroidales bacterium]
MTRSDKKLKELSVTLDKGNSDMKREAINALREEQPFEGVINVLAEHYNKSDDNDVRRTIENFMNDLKDPSVRPEVIDTIRKRWNDKTLSMLISSCWQSGLDYSEYSLDMAKAFMQSDYVTAIECLTVIEESAGSLDKDKKKEIIKLLQSGTFKAPAEKRELTLELISVLNM